MKVAECLMYPALWFWKACHKNQPYDKCTPWFQVSWQTGRKKDKDTKGPGISLSG